MSTLPEPQLYLRAMTGQVVPSQLDGPVTSILTFPVIDLAGDWVRPDGGDWSDYPKHPVVNWAHDIPIGRGSVEHKSLEFGGEQTVVAVGTTTFFKSAADVEGIDRTQLDNPSSRKPVGLYTVDECLRAAQDAEILVRNGLATGVSIEFLPNGPVGKAFWDLPGKSPLAPRNARHFESWKGVGYAHARQPVNPGCRTTMDGNEVVEKAIRVIESGKLGDHKFTDMVMKAFRDPSVMLAAMGNRAATIRVEGEVPKPEVKADDISCPSCYTPAARDADDNVCTSCGHDYSPTGKSMDVTVKADRSMFGEHARAARDASQHLHDTAASTGVLHAGAEEVVGGRVPKAGTLGGMIHTANEHAQSGRYKEASAVHAKIGHKLLRQAADAPPGDPQGQGLAEDARSHFTAANLHEAAHGATTKKPNRPLVYSNTRRPGPGLNVGSYGYEMNRREGFGTYPQPASHSDKIKNALYASQDAHREGTSALSAADRTRHADLLSNAYKASKNWDSGAAHDWHTNLANFHEEQASKLAWHPEAANRHKVAADMNREAASIHFERDQIKRRGKPIIDDSYKAPTSFLGQVASAFRPKGTFTRKAMDEFDIPEPPELKSFDDDAPADPRVVARIATDLANRKSGSTPAYTVKSMMSPDQTAASHRRVAKSLGGSHPAAGMHLRAAEMWDRVADATGPAVPAPVVKAAAGNPMNSTDPSIPAISSAGQGDGPPAGVRALLNFAQLLVDGSTALGYDIQSSDDVTLRVYAKSLQDKAVEMAAELKGLADKLQSRLDSPDPKVPHPLGTDDNSTPAVDGQPVVTPKSFPDLEYHADHAIMVKAYPEWKPRRFHVSALKDLPAKNVEAKSNPNVDAEAAAELKKQLDRLAKLQKQASEIQEALAAQKEG